MGLGRSALGARGAFQLPSSVAAGVALAAVAAGVFVAALDQTVVVTALPAIFSDIDLPVTRLDRGAWIVTGYLVGYTAAMPLMGRVSDAYGHGRVFLLSLLLFALGSGLVAIGGSLGWIVAARLVQAIGGGAMVPVAIAIAHESFPGSRRGIAIGAIAGIAEAGSVLGPLYGGAVLRALDWRWVFWLNLPLCVLVAVPVLAFVRSERRPAMRVDYFGAALLGGSLVLVALGLSGLPGLESGAIARAALLSAAAGLLAGFILWQARSAHPLLPLDAFRRMAVAGASGANLLVGAALILALVTIPLMSDTIMGTPPLEGGLRLLRLTAMIPPGAVLGGFLLRYLGYRGPAAAGLGLAALGFLLLSRWPLDVAEPRLTLELMVGGLGFGLVIVPLAVVTLNSVPEGQRATASAMLTVMRMMGMIAGMAALSSWGKDRFTSLVERIPSPLLGSGVTEEQAALYQSQVTGAALRFFHEVFIAGMIVSLLALVPVLLLLRRSGAGRRE